MLFDDAKEITVTGTVKKLQYTNPHSWLLVDITSGDGKVLDPQAGFVIR